MLKRAGLSRLKDLDPVVPARRYEHADAGDMIHLGIKKLGRFERTGHRVTGDRPIPMSMTYCVRQSPRPLSRSWAAATIRKQDNPIAAMNAAVTRSFTGLSRTAFSLCVFCMGVWTQPGILDGGTGRAANA